MKKTKIYGHRGAMGEYPENTLLSFKQAIEQGADGLEIDVQLTKDGEVVVIHDERLDRTTTGSGFVKDLTLNEIKQYSAGANFKHLLKYNEAWVEETVPTLVEVFAFLAPYPEIELNIELKTFPLRYPGIEERVLKLSSLYGGNRNIIYSSFHLPSILSIKAMNDEAKIAWLLNQPISHPNEYCEALLLDGLHMGKNSILKKPSFLKEYNSQLRAWTVNSTDEIKQLLDLKVDVIMTNYPEKAVFFRNEREVFV
ncbi:glycerophosphodiester phosphodiesterase [Ralstonia pickettii]|nr:glycerophosphodiester phosphodiesterase [Ralstonia pickettii]